MTKVFCIHFLLFIYCDYFLAERGGNVGILHYIEDDAEVEWLIQNGIHKPYVVMMSPKTFNR